MPGKHKTPCRYGITLTHRRDSHKEVGFGIIGIKGQTWRQPQLLTIARHILNQLQIGVATDSVKTNQLC